MSLLRVLLFASVSVLSINLFGQNAVWQKTGSKLPKETYDLQVSREGALYAVRKSSQNIVYRYVPSINGWSTEATLPPLNLQILYNDFFIGSAKSSNFDTTILTIVSGVNHDSIQTIRIYPSISRIEIGSDTSIYVGTSLDGALRTRDRGANWDTLRFQKGVYESIYSLWVSENKLYMSSNDDVVSTTDDGITWKEIYFGAPVVLLKGHRDTLYGIRNNGDFFSGVDTLIPTGTKVSAAFSPTLHIDKDGVLYFFNSFSSDVRRSFNGGKSWDTLSFTEVSGFTCDSSGVLYLATSSADHRDDYIYLSTDHGSTWTEMTSLNGSPLGTLFAADDSALVSGALLGISISTDQGYSWKNDTIPGISKKYSLTVDLAGELFAICRNVSNEVVLGTKHFLPDAWSFTSPMPFEDASSPYLTSGRFPTGELWAVDAEGNFSVHELGGTWRNSLVLDVPGVDIRTAASIDSHTVIVTGFAAIYRSSDTGKIFRRIFDLTDANEIGEVITYSHSAVYILTSYDRILVSTDKGVTWQPFAAPTEALTDIVTTRTGAIYLATENGVHRNLTGFNNPFVWEDISGDLQGLNIQHLALRGNKRLYAATAEGNVYFTDLPPSSVMQNTHQSSKLCIIPNPAQYNCYISGPLGLENAEVTVYNTLGEMVRKQTNQELDVATLPVGAYRVVVRIHNNVYSSLLLVER